MAKGMKVSKGNGIDVATHPQTVTFANSTNTSVTSYIGGVGGNSSAKTILVNYKMADGTAKTDGFIVRQRGRKVFDVQSASGGASTLTRCRLVESGTLSASQMYIAFGYNGGGTQYASRISNRYVWTMGDSVRLDYTLASPSDVDYIQANAGVVFVYADGVSTNPGGMAVVEAL